MKVVSRKATAIHRPGGVRRQCGGHADELFEGGGAGEANRGEDDEGRGDCRRPALGARDETAECKDGRDQYDPRYEEQDVRRLPCSLVLGDGADGLCGVASVLGVHGEASKKDRRSGDHAHLLRSRERRLTPREAEVLRAMAEGKRNAAIGTQLSLSGSAIEKHVNAIFSKLDLGESPDVDRRVSAVLRFLQERNL